MTGCPVAFACAVAWRFGELSQQRIRPQLVHRRRCTHQPSTSRQSSHPGISAGTSANSIVSRWLQVVATSPLKLHRLRLPTVQAAFDVGPLDGSSLALERLELAAGSTAAIGSAAHDSLLYVGSGAGVFSVGPDPTPVCGGSAGLV